MNSLDPRAKRFRAADTSLQQARNSLKGALLALQDIPHSKISAMFEAHGAINRAIVAIDDASAQLDEARMEGAREE